MSLITELPAIFDSFSDARRQGFLAVMALKERQIPWSALTAPSCRRRWRWPPAP